MPLYYCVLLTIFKDLTTRGNLPAIVGSPPFEHTSGISIRGKTQTSSLANKEVKVYLTRAAITAISWDPQMKAYYKRKIAEGKHKASVINASKSQIISKVFSCDTKADSICNISRIIKRSLTSKIS